MRLFDTAQRQVVALDLPEHVRMYVCGITPYDSTHLGHANTYLTYDLLIRRLEDLGHSVELVRNYTDVDDSILPKARELGVDFLELAEAEMARFAHDVIRPHPMLPCISAPGQPHADGRRPPPSEGGARWRRLGQRARRRVQSSNVPKYLSLPLPMRAQQPNIRKISKRSHVDQQELQR